MSETPKISYRPTGAAEGINAHLLKVTPRISAHLTRAIFPYVEQATVAVGDDATRIKVESAHPYDMVAAVRDLAATAFSGEAVQIQGVESTD